MPSLSVPNRLKPQTTWRRKCAKRYIFFVLVNSLNLRYIRVKTRNGVSRRPPSRPLPLFNTSLHLISRNGCFFVLRSLFYFFFKFKPNKSPLISKSPSLVTTCPSNQWRLRTLRTFFKPLPSVNRLNFKNYCALQKTKTILHVTKLAIFREPSH